MAFNWLEYFKQEKDVYIQNVSGMRISMVFSDSHGRAHSHSFDPSSRPAQLTQYIPFDAIKNSVDFRKLVARRPPMIVLLTEEEFRNYYAEMAKSAGLFTKDEKGKKVPDVEAALDKVEADRRKHVQREPLADAKEQDPIHEVEEDDSGKKVARAPAPVSEEDLIHPKVIHLCNQVKNEVPENEKMPASELIMELKGLGAVLKLDDWEYVRAHGWYASVKKLAKAEIEKLAKKSEGAED